MNPIGHGIFKALRNKRTCPNCGKQQVVPPERRDQTVECKHCGAEIPPPRRE
jgi:ribosomal protein S27E